jgi:uncharacterized protein YbjT (DUF2867 family)
MKIVVIGGTGLIGSKVVEKLQQKGHEAIAAAPNTGVNTITGEGLAEALMGADVVVNVAIRRHSKTRPQWTSSRSPAGISRRPKWQPASVITSLFRLSAPSACRPAGISAPNSPRRTISRTRRSPYTLVRATQFFEFIRGIAQSGTEGDVARLPHAPFQPMAAEDVATAVAEAALAEPVNGTIEIAGPAVFRIDEIVARTLAHDEDRRQVIADPNALYFGLKLNEQSLLPSPGAQIGATSFDWWLTHVPPPAAR